MTKVGWIFFVSLLAVAFLYFFDHEKETTIEDTSDRGRDGRELQILRAQLETMRREQHAQDIERVVHQKPKDEDEPEQANEDVDTSDGALDPNKQQELLDWQLEAQEALLENTLNADGVDMEWARKAESRLYDAIRHPDVKGVTKTQIACRSMMCRIDLTFDGSDESRHGATIALHRLPWSAPAFYQISPDGNSTRIYLAREGMGLPTNEEQALLE